jgi:cysteine-rich repeat protein
VCTPGKGCDGQKAIACTANGLAISASTDCAATGQQCVGGACVTVVCQAGKAYCEGNVAKQCDATGASASVLKTCSAGEFCNQGACQPQVCAPGLPSCQGNAVVNCKADGSGFVEGAKDCGSQTCVGGACKKLACAPASQLCEDGKLKTCSPDGLSVTGDKTCGAGTYCGPNNVGEAGCQPQVCAPGQPTCDGNKAATCNVDGSGFLPGGLDCATQGKVCSGGACKSLACDPQKPLYCFGKLVKSCAADGLTTATVQTCAAGEYCEGGACKAQVCAGGSAVCSGNTATTCKADGSGYEAGGTPCGSQKCVAGGCKAVLCQPATLTCQDGKLKTCSVDGTAFASEKTCGAGTFCGTGAGGEAACVPVVCEAGKQVCNGQLATTCKADGSGFVAGGVDCAGQGKTCQAGACVVGTVCGNGKVDLLGEQCDDGNLLAGDGCSANCVLEDAYSLVISADAPSRRYRLNETAGTEAIDASGNLLHGVFEGGIQLGQTGTLDSGKKGAVGFNGKTGRVVTPKLVLPAKFSIEAWFLSTGALNQEGYYPIASQPAQNPKVGSSNFTAAFGLHVWKGSHLDFFAGNGSGYAVEFIELSGKYVPVTTGAWLHTVVTVDTVQKAVNMYLQGKLVASVPWNGTLQQPGTPMYLGFFENNAWPMWFAGSLDEVALYPSVLSAQQVASHFQAAKAGGTSCKAILDNFPGSPNGVYPIDPDGAGPIAPANLFCDMKNGGLTLVANIYDSAGDDAPNSTDYVVSGWQQTASGKWDAKASTVDRAWGGGSGSAAVSLAFVQALGASAGQKSLKMCFVHKDGYDTTCRQSSDGSMTLVSYATGNPKLTVYAADKLTYTFGRLAGLAGSADGYDYSKLPVDTNSGCIPRKVGIPGEFGANSAFGLCEANSSGYSTYNGVWAGIGAGASYSPSSTDDWELKGGPVDNVQAVANPLPSSYGFRLYIGP